MSIDVQITQSESDTSLSVFDIRRNVGSSAIEKEHLVGKAMSDCMFKESFSESGMLLLPYSKSPAILFPSLLFR